MTTAANPEVNPQSTDNLIRMKAAVRPATGADRSIGGFTPMFANYQYSLTGAQQSAIQIWLRSAISGEGQQSPEWKLLHDMTYTENWTPNNPVFEMDGEREAMCAAKCNRLPPHFAVWSCSKKVNCVRQNPRRKRETASRSRLRKSTESSKEF
jgi:hypothetical protein